MCTGRDERSYVLRDREYPLAKASPDCAGEIGQTLRGGVFAGRRRGEVGDDVLGLSAPQLVAVSMPLDLTEAGLKDRPPRDRAESLSSAIDPLPKISERISHSSFMLSGPLAAASR